MQVKQWIVSYLAGRKVILPAVIVGVLVLAGCNDDDVVDMDYLCSAQQEMEVICGFQAPEDFEWLPDGSGMIVSEYGQMGAMEGRLTLMELDGYQITHLYDSQTAKRNITNNIWGDPDCDEPEYFSPHGISLAQRPSGRWQLLVVNHGEREAVEYFELKQIEGHWYLEWRGCVAAEGNDLFNDVSAAARGFYVTRFYKASSSLAPVWDYFFKRKNGVVKRWSIDNRWEVLEGTAAPLTNGVLWNAKDDELVVNEWGSGKVSIYNGKGEKKRELKMSFPDNVTWDAKRENYYVASKGGSFLGSYNCGAKRSEHCQTPFSIVEITPNSDQARVRFKSDGSFFGAGTAAIERDNKLYIGSFTGSRMLVVE